MVSGKAVSVPSTSDPDGRLHEQLARLKQRGRSVLAPAARGVLYGFHAETAPMEFAPGHFHSPLPSVVDINEYRSVAGSVPTAPAGVELGIDRQLETLRRLKPFIDDQPFGTGGETGLRYQFRNGWFSGTDPIVLRAMLLAFEPRRIIEVGSGWSTAAMLDTYDGRQMPQLTLVEPYPERLFELLRPGDRTRFRLFERRLQDIALEEFDALEAGDVLFVDSTHVAKLGSDVNHLFFEILPRLAVGVLVHLHDVMYAFEYEIGFVEAGYGWNEVYLLRAFLQFNRAFEIFLWNDMLVKLADQQLRDEFPALAENRANPEGSIWLRRTG
jgi:hypothetical protein